LYRVCDMENETKQEKEKKMESCLKKKYEEKQFITNRGKIVTILEELKLLKDIKESIDHMAGDDIILHFSEMKHINHIGCGSNGEKRRYLTSQFNLFKDLVYFGFKEGNGLSNETIKEAKKYFTKKRICSDCFDSDGNRKEYTIKDTLGLYECRRKFGNFLNSAYLNSMHTDSEGSTCKGVLMIPLMFFVLFKLRIPEGYAVKQINIIPSKVTKYTNLMRSRLYLYVTDNK